MERKPIVLVEEGAISPESLQSLLKESGYKVMTVPYQDLERVIQSILSPKGAKVTQAEAAPAEAKGAAASTTQKQCLWMKLGVVSYRLCTRDYDCLTCEFDQKMQEGARSGGSLEMAEAEALERLKALPGHKRLCRYALKGEVSYRLCSRNYQCAACSFDQMMQDIMEQKFAKLEARRGALRKKQETAQAKG